LSKLPSTSAITGASSIAPSVLPHAGQKDRLEKSDDRNVDGAPPGPVHETSSRANSTQDVVSAPEWRWHILQEHVCGFVGTPTASNRIRPQRHPPVYVFGFTRNAPSRQLHLK
jgi:hypothetical protein